MKFQTFVITLCISTLTACAVEKNDNAQVAASPESRTRTEEQAGELLDQATGGETAIIAVQAPPEKKTEGEVGISEVLARRNGPAVMYEHDAVAATKHMAADRR